MATNEMANDFSSRRAPKHHIRNMTDNDVQQVLNIWGENGLHEGTHTIQSFLKVDPNGFIVAVDDESGMLSVLSLIIKDY
jgi:ribosomal protein S18 acetylase RimI-like enzyme